MLVINDMYD